MKIIEVGTGYTSIPANIGAATEIVVEELAKSFEKENVNYEIFDIKDENRKKTNLKIKEIYIPKLFRRKDVSLGIMHKLKRVFYSISVAIALKKEIKKNNEKITIHFHNQYNMFFFSKLTSKKIRNKVNIMYTVHSYIWNGKWDDIKETINSRYFQEVFSVKNANKVFVLNDITKKHFIDQFGIDENKIIKINNGVNTEIYKPSNIENEEMIFFQTGSICDRKNQLDAINMLMPYLKQNSTYQYLYAGGIIDQTYKSKIDELVQENNMQNQIKYLGELSPGIELSKYYGQAKVFVFPSTAEAFSLVILEAMASGLPVIMNRKAILEIDPKLENVMLFYEDKITFDDIMQNKILNEEERIKISEKSRKTVEDEYSWDVVAKRYYEEFK